MSLLGGALHGKSVKLSEEFQSNWNSTVSQIPELSKPQAFHQSPILVAGGLGIFFAFLINYFYFLLFKNIILFEYLTFCTLIFFIGLIDDLKINVKAKTRLALMIIFLVYWEGYYVIS